jgi:hypothetical protein
MCVIKRVPEKASAEQARRLNAEGEIVMDREFPGF